MKKIIISFICGIAFIAPTALSASLFFPDVRSSDWFYSDVKNMSDWGIIKGNKDGTYAPAKSVNRAELATILNRYEKRINSKLGSSSSNISTSAIDPSVIKRFETLEKKTEDALNIALQNDVLFFNSLKKDTADTFTKHNDFIAKNLIYIREIEPGKKFDTKALLPYDFSMSSADCTKVQNNFSSKNFGSAIYANEIKNVGCK